MRNPFIHHTKRICPYCHCQVKNKRYKSHVESRCPQKHPKRGHRVSKAAHLDKHLLEAKVCSYCKAQIYTPFYEDHLRICKSKKKCKYCGQIVSTPMYQQHIEQSHTNQKCKCNQCGLIIQLPKYAYHIEKECRGVLTRNCEYCGDPVVELNYERHIKWHETKRLKQAAILEIQRTNNQQRSLQAKAVGAKNTVIVKSDWRANDPYCRHCGRLAMPGSSSCYNCGDK
jgi:hypothetical protein